MKATKLWRAGLVGAGTWSSVTLDLPLPSMPHGTVPSSLAGAYFPPREGRRPSWPEWCIKHYLSQQCEFAIHAVHMTYRTDLRPFQAAEGSPFSLAGTRFPSH